MARKELVDLTVQSLDNSELNNLSEAESIFLGEYFPNISEKYSTDSCEYCGNGCGTSDCASCCTQPDEYIKFRKSLD